MSNVPSDQLQNSGRSLAPSSTQPDKLARPGWPEIIVGLGPVVNGLIFTALSGVAGIAALVATVVLRIRCLSEAAPAGAFKQ